MTSSLRLVVLVAGAAVLAGNRPAGTGSDGRPRRHVIVIAAMTFRPGVLAVAPGDTVVWVNQDLLPHTSTATPGWDSGSIGIGGTALFVPRRPGRFGYQCIFHPVMKGMLVVKNPSP